jgi:hypothetical protein
MSFDYVTGTVSLSWGAAIVSHSRELLLLWAPHELRPPVIGCPAIAWMDLVSMRLSIS